MKCFGVRAVVAILAISLGRDVGWGATINVPADQATIQGAINVAVSGVDEVVVAPGTYNQLINFLGKAITVRSSGGPAVTTIDVGPVANPGTGKPVVRCTTSETSTTVLDGFTLTGGTGDTIFGSASGGGMFIRNSSPTVKNCVFTANTAVFGGGMYISSTSIPTVTNCIFAGNTATSTGGGMYNVNGGPTVTNCVFSGNAATSFFGGGMNNFLSDPTVTNCTFSGNTAVMEGGGMYNGTSADPTITNGVLWGNSDVGGMDESAQIHVSGGTPTVNFSDVQGGWTGVGASNINVDPVFADADGADNTVGTVDDDLRLSGSSPCINAGDNSVVTEPTDLDGNTRIVATTVDMGAYENPCAAGPVHNITQGAFFCEIQAAIDGAVGGDVIEASPGTYDEIIDLLGKAITVRSTGGAAVTTIDATSAADPGSGKPVVRCDSGETAGTVLEGFTLTGGTGDTAEFAFSQGGGMYLNGTSPTVRNCVFSSNTAQYGGAMLHRPGSSPTLTNCVFVGNAATSFFGGGIYGYGSPTVTNCVFSGNAASIHGGGMFCDFGSEPKVINCTFSGNTASASGGGMNTALGDPVVINCIFWGNSDNGGMDESAQIHIISGTTTVNYSDVQGGWSGAGSNNINADPLFVDADGADNTVGTVDDDLRLSAGSPCIDAADFSVYHPGPMLDLGGLDRTVDDPSTADTGSGVLTFLDMGAHEIEGTCGFPPGVVRADFDEDGDVDGVDFATFASCFNKAGNPPRTLGCPQ